MTEMARRRRAKNFSREYLASEIGVKARTIASYERGEREPSIDKLLKLANVLDCTVDDLIHPDCSSSEG